MRTSSEVLIGIDTTKARNAVAVAEGGRDGEVRYLGEFDNTGMAEQLLHANESALSPIPNADVARHCARYALAEY
jgi:hypothetical protein